MGARGNRQVLQFPNCSCGWLLVVLCSFCCQFPGGDIISPPGGNSCPDFSVCIPGLVKVYTQHCLGLFRRCLRRFPFLLAIPFTHLLAKIKSPAGNLLTGSWRFTYNLVLSSRVMSPCHCSTSKIAYLTAEAPFVSVS